jgi:hypothetical protein
VSNVYFTDAFVEDKGDDFLPQLKEKIHKCSFFMSPLLQFLAFAKQRLAGATLTSFLLSI